MEKQPKINMFNFIIMRIVRRCPPNDIFIHRSFYLAISIYYLCFFFPGNSQFPTLFEIGYSNSSVRPTENRISLHSNEETLQHLM